MRRLKVKPPLVLTVAEVQQLLRLSRPSAYRLCRKIGIRAGHRLFVERTAFAAFIAARGVVSARHLQDMEERLERAVES